ncbi:hypothetical protein GCM10025771_10670 [Niveibacterium umoris]|uniref:Uncharacterized protein n=1 Tax=Niveibacterium umoris TaxID=1193620 RepID=A0A840BNZ2_9RHOO|nr:hypothetical protein [Niveibacterium umoris]MBB4013382.1 hypothetical protein [Niveibacterium umoris]
MNGDVRWASSVAAGLAAGGRWPCAWTMLAGLLVVARAGHGEPPALLALSLMLALAALYVALRLELDRLLFADLAIDLGTIAPNDVLTKLDAGLGLVLDRAKPPRERALPDRIRGLRRWVTTAAVLAVLQSFVLWVVVLR